MRKATMPVLNKAGKTVIPVTVTSVYALAPNGSKGATASRPGSPTTFQPYYDTDLQEQVFYHAGRSRWENHMGEARP